MPEKPYSKTYEKKWSVWKKYGFFFKVCSFIKYFGIRYTNKKDAQHEYYGKD